ncbi:MAG TPA: DNA sulfur modification protein DndB [Candidatus Angelobacter sp.]|nr:DNA sulfur modification protein DndB [Candidatus Angelobacter sp.]
MENIVSQAQTKPEATTLGDLLTSAEVTRPVPVLVGRNMGHPTFSMIMPWQNFMDRSLVGNEEEIYGDDGEEYGITQRKLDVKHATKFAVFILKALVAYAMRKRSSAGKEPEEELLKLQENLGQQTYCAIQPLVCNIRKCEPAGGDLKVDKVAKWDGACLVYLPEKLVFWIVDGQHRRAAMQLAADFLRTLLGNRRYPIRPKLYEAAHKEPLTKGELYVWNELFEIFRSEWTVAIEVHLGLKPDEERQLFHDLNNLGKRVEDGLAYQFDTANPVNVFIKDELVKPESEGGFWRPALVERDVTDWHNDSGVISRKDVIAINAVLFLNKTNVAGAQPSAVDKRRETALEFWKAVNEIPHFGEPEAKLKTVAAQPVVLKALAKLTYDFAFGKNPDQESLQKLFAGLRTVHGLFSHDNPMWRYYQLPQQELQKYGLKPLAEYLPEQTEGNRDVGHFDGRHMRFGAKHNDIFPILGDMIRWKLGLPNRRESAEK